ncbi:hypothetical protein QUA79_12915 [Microcoleus sp. F8-D1]
MLWARPSKLYGRCGTGVPWVCTVIFGDFLTADAARLTPIDAD